MTANDQCIQAQDGGILIHVWVQPGAKKNEVSGQYQGCLKIRLQARPVDNKANQELVAFLAAILEVKTRQVRLVSGHKNRKKIVSVQMDGESVLKQVRDSLGPGSGKR
ncbi:MAG: DUF167 domain-containing protein [Thermodesulfobacteriota bacterium]